MSDNVSPSSNNAADNSSDLVSKVLAANSLEQQGKISDAIALYQEIVQLDSGGTYGNTAQQALDNLSNLSSASNTVSPEPKQPIDSSNSSDLVSKVPAANSLEQEGKISGAIALYQEIVQLDPGGIYGKTAQQALNNLSNLASASDTVQTKTIKKYRGQIIGDHGTKGNNKSGILSLFYDLPIRRKQFTTVVATQLFSVLGVVGAGAFLIVNTGREQLVQQAKLELEVAQINYNLKINQMGFGFQGQADNATLIEAAKTRKYSPAAKAVLINETWKRKIEFATLVDTNARIIVNSNIDRYGDEFNPEGLVTKAIANDTQIKTSEFISYEELVKESPRFAKLILDLKQVRAEELPYLLIRYTITPMKNAGGGRIGALISADIVKAAIFENTNATFDGGFSGVYKVYPDGQITRGITNLQLANGTIKSQVNVSNLALVKEAVQAKGEIVTGTDTIEGKTYTVAAKAITNYAGEPIAVLLRGTPQASLNILLLNSLSIQGLVLVVVVFISASIATYLGKAITDPIEELQATTRKFTSGDRFVRAEVMGKDELGELSAIFNEMVHSIKASEEKLLAISQTQEAEAKAQKQARETLQQEVIELLLDIEGARKGDLTVEAKLTEGPVGSIADAFNSTIRNLKQLVLRVQAVASEVDYLSQNSESSVSLLSEAALSQADEINLTLNNIVEINNSIQSVASSTQEAAKVARLAKNKAKKGDATMVQTVESIDKIRSTVADTSKKVKQLAESSQEISQIVEIIGEISEKTNLLAFNASIEASRAGEHGEGFRIVAEEVRRLADQVTDATKNIQQLVSNIQTETSQVLEAMEVGTSEVVTGTELIRKTQLTLQSLAKTSEQIDQYLQSIATNTTEQTQSSEAINLKIIDVANIAQTTSQEAQDVVQSLQSLVKEAQTLQSSVSEFRVKS
ncbi:MAG: methyl-accepting chemotaxis protein [Xenococcaceae cyanobacterium MO_167.B27]|nr:methyl-accepting chemotaxis protein [Xenococcaceae cyanobacterium MO_167.B27]